MIQAAKAMKEQNAQAASRHSSGKMMWGRLKRGPNLPSKPPIQSSESSTDDLSGSEDSSSSDIDDKEETQKKEESNMPGNGTEDDDDDLVDANDQIKPKPKAGDLSIEIKIGKDKDKSKTLLGMISHKKSLITIFGHKHLILKSKKLKTFIRNL